MERNLEKAEKRKGGTYIEGRESKQMDGKGKTERGELRRNHEGETVGEG